MKDRPLFQHGLQKLLLTISSIHMISAELKHHSIRPYLACLIAVLFIFTTNACTTKRGSLAPGIIPELAAPSPGAEKYGNLLFQGLRKDYDLDSESQQYEKLNEIFKQLIIAAEVGHLPWHIYLLDKPEIADIRAVHGNYIFVWSGIMDAVESDDEFAGLLACELSHALARHRPRGVYPRIRIILQYSGTGNQHRNYGGKPGRSCD